MRTIGAREVTEEAKREAFVNYVFSDQGRAEIEDLIFNLLQKNGIRDNLPRDLDLARSLSDLIRTVTARGLVLGESLAGEVLAAPQRRLALTPLSEAARFLLGRPDVLTQAYQEWAKSQEEFATLDLKKPILIDATFAEDRKKLEAFIKNALRVGERVGISYDMDMPRHANLARELVQFFLEVAAIGYHSDRPLTASKVGMALGRRELFGLLSTNTAVDASLLNQTITATPGLVGPAVQTLGWSPFLRAAEVALLRSQIEKKAPSVRHVLDERALNSAIEFLNMLAQTEVARQAMARAA